MGLCIYRSAGEKTQQDCGTDTQSPRLDSQGRFDTRRIQIPSDEYFEPFASTAPWYSVQATVTHPKGVVEAVLMKPDWVKNERAELSNMVLMTVNPAYLRLVAPTGFLTPLWIRMNHPNGLYARIRVLKPGTNTQIIWDEMGLHKPHDYVKGSSMLVGPWAHRPLLFGTTGRAYLNKPVDLQITIHVAGGGENNIALIRHRTIFNRDMLKTIPAIKLGKEVPNKYDIVK